jgi:hypothetical protein
MAAIGSYLKDYPGANLNEMARILPDSLVIMSGVMAILTTSLPLGILFGSFLESILFFHVLHKGFSYFDVSFLKQGPKAFSNACRTGFTTPTLTDLSLFGTNQTMNALPSAPIYILSVAIGYIYTAINNQKRELEALGPVYSSRFYISILGMALFLFLISAYRMWAECDSLPVILLTIVIGVIIGSLLTLQNMAFFGPDSTNLTAIPLLRNRAANGEQLYVCSVRNPPNK